MNEIKNREDWLEAAVVKLTPAFKQAGYKVPKIRVACGWPHRGGTKAKARTLGQCWGTEAAKDEVNQIFISPYLEDVIDPQGVLSTLVHEVCHAVVGVKESHNKVFGKCARAMGLEGKLTSTHAGEESLKALTAISKELGKYPHAQLDLKKSPIKKQSTRMHKCECAECGYVVRISAKWLLEVGEPHCPKHGAMKQDKPIEKDEDDE